MCVVNGIEDGREIQEGEGCVKRFGYVEKDRSEY